MRLANNRQCRSWTRWACWSCTHSPWSWRKTQCWIRSWSHFRCVLYALCIVIKHVRPALLTLLVRSAISNSIFCQLSPVSVMTPIANCLLALPATLNTCCIGSSPPWTRASLHSVSWLTQSQLSTFDHTSILRDNKKAQLMLAYPRDAKTMKKSPPFRSYNKFQSSRKSGVYSN